MVQRHTSRWSAGSDCHSGPQDRCSAGQRDTACDYELRCDLYLMKLHYSNYYQNLKTEEDEWKPNDNISLSQLLFSLFWILMLKWMYCHCVVLWYGTCLVGLGVAGFVNRAVEEAWGAWVTILWLRAPPTQTPDLTVSAIHHLNELSDSGKEQTGSS